MRTRSLYIMLAVVLPGAIVAAFQGCGGAFAPMQSKSQSLSSAGVPNPPGSSSPPVDTSARGAALYKVNCSSCHGELATSAKRGVSKLQITDAIARIDQMKSIATLQALSSADIEQIANALSAPVYTKPQSNMTRARNDVIAIRLKAIFPDFDTNQMTDGSNSLAYFLGQPDFLSRFTASNSTAPTAQLSFKKAVIQLCRSSSGASRLFSTAGILMRGETLPKDAMTVRAFAALRNGWLYPYPANSTEVQALVNLAKEASVGAADPQGEADFSICLATFLAPQFWLGTPGEFEAIKRMALEIGHRPPTFDEFSRFQDGSMTLKDYLHRLQGEASYLETIKTWHRNWLAPMDYNKYSGGYGKNLPPPPRGYKLYFAWEGPGLLAGQFFIPTRPTGGLDPTIPIVEQTSQNKTSLSRTENCQPVAQAFNPVTERLQWEHNVGGVWYIVGGWKKIAGAWQSFGGSVPIGGAMVTTSVSDIRYTPIAAAGKYHYLGGALAALGNFAAGDRRLRRFTTPDDVPANGPSPRQEQNGYSQIKLWWSGKPVHVCNNLSRFLAACAYRPATKGGLTYDPEKNWQADQPTVRMLMGGAAFIGVDSLGHPGVLDQMRCWIDPNRFPGPARAPTAAETAQAYPVSGRPQDLNDKALNFELLMYDAQLAAAYPSLQEEAAAVQSIFDDMRDEPMNLVADIVQNNLDYRNLLTANWTTGRGPLEIFYRSQAQFMTTYPPGVSTQPGDSGHMSMRKISLPSMAPIPAAWFQNSLGVPAYGNGAGYLHDPKAAVLHSRPVSGVLTQAAFMAPAKPKVRTLAARILRTFTCGEVNTFEPDASQTDMQLKFVPIHERSGSMHVDRTQSCFKCHINMDPLSSALSSGFLSVTGVVGAPGKVMEALSARGELTPFSRADGYQGFSYGIVGQSINASKGALFGTEVTGITEAARVLADSPLFAKCAVTQAFKNLFGRDPLGSEDQSLIESVVQQWKAGGFNYNQMVEALVLSPQYQRRD